MLLATCASAGGSRRRRLTLSHSCRNIPTDCRGLLLVCQWFPVWRPPYPPLAARRAAACGIPWWRRSTLAPSARACSPTSCATTCGARRRRAAGQHALHTLLRSSGPVSRPLSARPQGRREVARRAVQQPTGRRRPGGAVRQPAGRRVPLQHSGGHVAAGGGPAAAAAAPGAGGLLLWQRRRRPRAGAPTAGGGTARLRTATAKP